MRTTTPDRRAIGRDLMVLALTAGILYFSALGSRDLWNPNEGTYGRVVVEMLRSGDWLLPTLNAATFAEKPVLYYWLALVSSSLTGRVSELSLRMPNALAGVAATLLTYLLILPYVGRRRALWGGALLATQYLVWWTSRTIQMDSFVLLSTLAVLLLFTRAFDFNLSPGLLWFGVGTICGLGFAAKGPVTVVIPAIIVLAWSLIIRGPMLDLLRGWRWIWGLVAFAAVGLPWYGLLLAGGHHEALSEVLLRQNFSRYVAAWDHRQPWWYFLKYFWISYAPWSWLVPIAAFLRSRTPQEGRLHRLAWVWILGTILFFSLADSKRSAYILPIAPAVAVLASAVVDRLVELSLSAPLRRAALLVVALFGAIFAAGGLYILGPELADRIPEAVPTSLIGLTLLACGGTIVVSTLIRNRPYLAPAALASGVAAVFLVTSVSVLPAFNTVKSHRRFAEEVRAAGFANVSMISYFGNRKWVRGGYAYYLGRLVPNIGTAQGVESMWSRGEVTCLLVEEPQYSQIVGRLAGARVVVERPIGGEIGRLLCQREVRTADAVAGDLARVLGTGP